MQINIGCFYFIKDSFFDIIDDPELMQNKENGNKRPCYYCFKSKTYSEFIPVSTKIENMIYNSSFIFFISISSISLIAINSKSFTIRCSFSIK